MSFEDFDKWSAEWEARTRYAIRGNSGSKYEGKALGICIAEDTSDLAFVFNDKWYAEKFLSEYSAEIKNNFHIEEVDSNLLHTTFRKARII